MKKDLSMELPPLILPNTGNMGIPICLFAYGTQGLGVASAIASVIILFHFTLGIFLAKKKIFFRYCYQKSTCICNYYICYFFIFSD